MNEIYQLDTIEEIEKFVNQQNVTGLRNALFEELDRIIDYKNIAEWNKIVRIFEALAIIGWGEREPLEAFANKWINGAFYTVIQNKHFEKHSEKGWSRKGTSFVLEDGEDNTVYEETKLRSQRNRLPKSPVRWQKSGNYQKSAKAFRLELDNLKNLVIKQLNPEAYGKDFSYLGIHFNFSYHDDDEPTVRSEYFHTENDVPENYEGKYYIRPKFKIGRLSNKDGKPRLVVWRYFTRKFGELSLAEQKEIVGNDMLELIDILATKLKKKKIDYKTDLLKADMKNVLQKW